MGMIKPETLYQLFKKCDNSKWLGDICRSLGGQEVALDYGQEQAKNLIDIDIAKFEEVVVKEKERQAKLYQERKKKWLEKQKQIQQVSTVENNTQQIQQVSTNQYNTLHSNTLHSTPIQINPQGVDNSACLLNIAREEEGEKKHHPPSIEQVMMVASANHISKEFAQAFYDDLECDDWKYINNAGVTVKVTGANVGIVLRGRWQNFQRRTEANRKKASNKTNQPKGVVYQEEDYDFSKFESDDGGAK